MKAHRRNAEILRCTQNDRTLYKIHPPDWNAVLNFRKRDLSEQISRLRCTPLEMTITREICAWIIAVIYINLYNNLSLRIKSSNRKGRHLG